MSSIYLPVLEYIFHTISHSTFSFSKLPYTIILEQHECTPINLFDSKRKVKEQNCKCENDSKKIVWGKTNAC